VDARQRILEAAAVCTGLAKYAYVEKAYRDSQLLGECAATLLRLTLSLNTANTHRAAHLFAQSDEFIAQLRKDMDSWPES
jgi:hypothetical protein